MKKAAGWAVGFLLLGFFGLLLVLGGLGGAVGGLTQSQQQCGGQNAVAVAVGGLPARVGAYSGDQLRNAAAIMQAAKDKGFPLQGQRIAVMTAMGESSLVNIDHGDLVGPDSTGLFQQRDPWGPRPDRMDPYKSAVMFLTGGQGGQKGLDDVPGWESLPPTIAAHRVQVNADPYHYEKFWTAAGDVLTALSGASVSTTGGASSCEVTSVAVGPGGWARPTTGPTTSPFGMRGGKPHNGQDIAPPCGTPVSAAGPGTVVLVVLNNAPPASGYGTLIAIDHGGGIVTRYAHAFPQDVLVRVGDVVAAGQQISRVGTFGDSTGCHLHFEIQRGGAFIDPAPFMALAGAAL